MASHDHHHGHHLQRRGHESGRIGLRVAVITVSDTRTESTDESGRVIREMVSRANHRVVSHTIVPDAADRIRAAIESCVEAADVVILTGGTGIAERDVTIETVRPLLERELEGFGELFRMLSYQEIGAAAFLSRALAGIVKGKMLAALPGSPDACRLALGKLLLPEIGHIASLLHL
jgi:molybdenum cofactor biosynthesis protein B